MEQVTPLVVPQVNVNDDTVLLVRWSVEQYGQVAAGDTVCEVETSKASAEVTADRGGVLVQSAAAPVRVRIGEEIGAIGPTREAAAAYLQARAAPKTAAADGTVKATAKAMARASQEGVSLEAVARVKRGVTIEQAQSRRASRACSNDGWSGAHSTRARKVRGTHRRDPGVRRGRRGEPQTFH